MGPVVQPRSLSEAPPEAPIPLHSTIQEECLAPEPNVHGTTFKCSMGCDYDICQKCYECAVALGAAAPSTAPATVPHAGATPDVEMRADSGAASAGGATAEEEADTVATAGDAGAGVGAEAGAETDAPSIAEAQHATRGEGWQGSGTGSAAAAAATGAMTTDAAALAATDTAAAAAAGVDVGVDMDVEMAGAESPASGPSSLAPVTPRGSSAAATGAGAETEMDVGASAGASAGAGLDAGVGATDAAAIGAAVPDVAIAAGAAGVEMVVGTADPATIGGCHSGPSSPAPRLPGCSRVGHVVVGPAAVRATLAGGEVTATDGATSDAACSAVEGDAAATPTVASTAPLALQASSSPPPPPPQAATPSSASSLEWPAAGAATPPAATPPDAPAVPAAPAVLRGRGRDRRALREGAAAEGAESAEGVLACAPAAPSAAGGSPAATAPSPASRGSRSQGAPPPRSSPIVLQVVGGKEGACRALRAASERLGGAFVRSEFFEPGCTHMIVATLKRGEKLLAALAAGCWLLRPGWVDASDATGTWAAEEAWELFEPGGGSFEGTARLWVGAPRRHRLRRQQGSAGGLHGLGLVVAPDISPTAATLGRIIAAGGGRVCSSLLEAGVTAAIVPEGAAAAHPLAQQAAARGLPCVTPDVVFALLTEQDPAPLAASMVTGGA